MHDYASVRPRLYLIWHDILILLHHVVLERMAHEALDAIDGVLRVRDCLALREGSHEALAVLRDGDDRRGRALAFSVLEHAGLAALHDGHCRVGRSKINTEYLCHR